MSKEKYKIAPEFLRRYPKLPNKEDEGSASMEFANPRRGKVRFRGEWVRG